MASASPALALLHGYACITHKGNQVVSGVAINILASGLTMVFGNAWFGQGGQTPSLEPSARFMPILWPARKPSARFQSSGRIYAAADQRPEPARLCRVGQCRRDLVRGDAHPLRASLACGGRGSCRHRRRRISVAWLRYRALLICGLLTGIAGTYIGIAQNANFSKDMSAGQGYIALAALIFGKWRPLPAFGACLIFGLLDAVAIRLQGVSVAGIGEIPVQFIQALPYVLTVILLAGLIGKAVAPKAIGVPYEKEH